MLIYIIVGSVRENRTAIKVANWLHQEIGNFSLQDMQTEIIDLKEWDQDLRIDGFKKVLQQFITYL